MWSKLTAKVNIVFVLFAGDPSNRAWLRAEVQLNLGSSFRVGFEGIVGGDDKTDIALDDISFSAGCYKVQIKCSEHILHFKVFRYSFAETIPMFFNRFKSDFILSRSPQNFHR